MDDFALASRLSYLLWSSMPDDELYQLAARANFCMRISRSWRRRRNGFWPIRARGSSRAISRVHGCALRSSSIPWTRTGANSPRTTMHYARRCYDEAFTFADNILRPHNGRPLLDSFSSTARLHLRERSARQTLRDSRCAGTRAAPGEFHGSSPWRPAGDGGYSYNDELSAAHQPGAAREVGAGGNPRHSPTATAAECAGSFRKTTAP